jgi:hypothetical protein
MITPLSTGRATTFFSTMCQVGSAVGVAILSTVLVAATSTQTSLEQLVTRRAKFLYAEWYPPETK